MSTETTIRTLSARVSSLEAPGDTLTSRLTPAQHAALVLRDGSKGMMVLGRWERETRLDRRGKSETKYRYRQSGAKANEVAEAIATHAPVLLTMNAYRVKGTFGGEYDEWPDKRLTNLLQIRAAWVELDFYKTAAWSSYTATEMVWHLLHRLRQEGLPAPSYVVSSGKGLHVVWLTEGVPSVALRAWQALQGRLNGLFHDMGADRVAAAATGNLRLVGTRNKGVEVAMIWPRTVGEIQRFSFKALCDEALPYSPEECREYRVKAEAERVERKALGKARVANGGSPALTVETYRATMEADLWKILNARYPEGEDVRTDEDDDGEHGRFLFAFARLWACRMSSDDLRAEVERFADRLGFSRKDAVREAGCVIRRLVGIERGQARRNRPGTGHYRFGPQTFVKAFGVTPELARQLDLRVIRPLSMKAERAKERQAKVRLSKGSKPRTKAKAERLVVGRKALAMRADGLTRERICEALGVKPAYLDKAVAEAKAAPALLAVEAPMPKAGRTARKPKAATSCVSSRYVATAANEPVALEADQPSTYTPPVRDRAAPILDKRPVKPSRFGGSFHVGSQEGRKLPVPAFVASLGDPVPA